MALYPSVVLENEFGEKTNNFMIGGSNQVWCKFVVANTNASGITSLDGTGSGVANVFMHTTTTPTTGSPNPAAGYIYVNLAAPYTFYRNGGSGIRPPLSGSPISVSAGLTAGLAYTITSLGTTTPAQWSTLGMPAGLTPALGLSFIAITSAAGGGTGQVQVPAASSIDHVELINDPNLTANAAGGSTLIFRCMSGGSLTAPAAGTTIDLSFNMVPVPKSLI